MCESDMQGIEGGPRGHYLTRLSTMRERGFEGVQGQTMVRAVLLGLERGDLCESDFSGHGIDLSILRDASQR